MTAAELKNEFLIGYDKVASLAAPGFTNDEISSILTKAQIRFVKTHYHPRGNKYQEGFEETEKRRKDLSSITRPGTGVVSASQLDLVSTNGVLYDLPSDHWLTVIEWVDTNDTCEPKKKVIPATLDEYLLLEENPFKKPSSKKFVRLDSSPLNGVSRHEIVTDGVSTITDYKFRYIKTLVDIDITNDITSELHPMTHDEIVDIAVTIALENQQEPRFQSHNALGQRSE